MINPRSTAQIAVHPIHPMLIPFPVVFLVTALVTDFAFWQTSIAIWATVSMWLLGAGIVMALVAATAGFTDFLGDGRIRKITAAWPHMIGNLTLSCWPSSMSAFAIDQALLLGCCHMGFGCPSSPFCSCSLTDGRGGTSFTNITWGYLTRHPSSRWRSPLVMLHF